MPSMPAAHYHQGLPCRDRSCAAANVPLEPGDLPEGQQPKDLSEVEQLRHEVKKLRWLERSAKRYALEAEKEAEEALAVAAERGAELARVRADMARYRVAEFDAENPAILVARVRADVAEEIAERIMSLRDAWLRDDPPFEADQVRRWRDAVGTALHDAASLARQHVVVPAESVVGAPTPISAPSDVAAPRDALTDQDFEGFNEAIKRARGPELFAQEGQPTCDAPHPLGGPACRRGVGHDYHLRRVSGGSEGWVALPEDEGTRQERLINVEE